MTAFDYDVLVFGPGIGSVCDTRGRVPLPAGLDPAVPKGNPGTAERAGAR